MAFDNEVIGTLKDISRKLTENRVCVGYQQLTIAGSVVQLTIPAGATRAVIRFESSVTSGIVVRYTEDGTTPVSGATGTGVGTPLSHLDILEILTAENLSLTNFIQSQAGTHVANINYYRS